MTSKVGNLGEELAIAWLSTNSYRILYHSWSCRWGEIDVIALTPDSQTLVFVEVKTRSSSNWDDDGLLAVSFGKQQKIIRSASIFLTQNPKYADLYMRFDVALVRHRKLPRSQDLKLKKQNLKSLKSRDSVKSRPPDPNLFIRQKAGYELQLLDYLENAFEIV